MGVFYIHDKINMVSDTRICMTMGNVSHVEQGKKDVVKYLHMFSRLGVRLEDSSNGGSTVHNNSESSLVVKVKSKQHIDLLLMELKKLVLSKSNESFFKEGMV